MKCALKELQLGQTFLCFPFPTLTHNVCVGRQARLFLDNVFCYLLYELWLSLYYIKTWFCETLCFLQYKILLPILKHGQL